MPKSATPKIAASQKAQQESKSMGISSSISPIRDFIRGKILPRLEEQGKSSFLVAEPTLKKLQATTPRLPAGIEVLPSPLHGRRVAVREHTLGYQVVSARWPRDGMDAKRVHNFACVVNGVADLKIGDYLLRCREGNFIFLPAGVPYADGSRPHLEVGEIQHRSCDIMWFSTSGDMVKCWFCHSEVDRHTGIPAFYVHRNNLPIQFNALFLKSLDSGKTGDVIRRGMLIALIASLVQEIEQGRFFRWLPEITLDVEKNHTDPIARAQDYIQRHLGEPLTIERVAHVVFMSRSQFARKFHEQTGETFNAFLTRCRLEEAKKHLTTTSVEIAPLGRYVGLRPRRFTQIFLEHTGLTPSAYRARYRIDDREASR